MAAGAGNKGQFRGFNALRQERRDRGLCTNCGKPALKCRKRALPVNRRLAQRRGLPSEYHAATGGRWKPGDLPPTLQRLTHEGLCRECKTERENASRKWRSKAKEKEEIRQQRGLKLHERYADWKRRGLCPRCGKEPPSKSGRTLEGDKCIAKRIARALESPDAKEVSRRIQAGESQASIRRSTGVTRSVVEGIAAALRQRNARSRRKR